MNPPSYAAQAAMDAALIVVFLFLGYRFCGTYWLALPALGLALTFPPLVVCCWHLWKDR